MKNKEKYAKEIMEIACSGSRIAINKGSGCIVPCGGLLCSKCLFRAIDCRKNIKEWAESEYVEKVVISRRDREFLEYIDKKFKYIARDETNRVYVYSIEPRKSEYCWIINRGESFSIANRIDVDFPMVKWSDSEPWLIEDLKKLDVVEEYEHE